MGSLESEFDFRRLFDLAARLGLSDVTAALSRLLEAEAEARAAAVGEAGKWLLRELAVRQKAARPVPEALEKWSRVAPALAGLEAMSQRELRHLEGLCREAQEAARAKIEALPPACQAKCRSILATALLTAADVAFPDGGRLAARLGRRLATGIRTIGRGVAWQLHYDLLCKLLAAVDALYSLASAADQVLRALGHATGAEAAPAAPSLVARLAERRERWERAVQNLSNQNADDVETALEVGALCVALGIEAVAASLRGLELPAAGVPEPKQTALEAAREALRREWAARAAEVPAAVDDHVAARFALLQREIDDWLAEAHRHLAALCGNATGDEEDLAAVSFEVTDISRRAAGREQGASP